MYDVVGKIMGYVIAALLIFVMPVANIMIKSDQTVQVYAQEAIEEFVDKASKTGIITDDSFSEMVRKLDGTDLIYDIHLTHSYQRVTPLLDESLNFNPDGEYEVTYIDLIDDEIFSIMQSNNGVYYLNDGDYIKVSIRNTTDTLGSKMMHLLANYNASNVITAQYGTYVEHEQVKFN